MEKQDLPRQFSPFQFQVLVSFHIVCVMCSMYAVSVFALMYIESLCVLLVCDV